MVAPLQDTMHGMTVNPLKRFKLLPTCFGDHEWTQHNHINDNSMVVTRRNKNIIACRLAQKAGIVSLAPNMYNRIWHTLIHLMTLLLEPGCTELVNRNFKYCLDKDDDALKVHLKDGESMRDIAPSPKMRGICVCFECNGPIIVHVLVPRHVEAAAKKHNILSKVYGEDWIMNTDPESDNWTIAMEAEIEEAKEAYVFLSETTPGGKEETDMEMDIDDEGDVDGDDDDEEDSEDSEEE